MTKQFYIYTFGCQMNVYDSDRLRDALIHNGWTLSSTPDTADLVVLNTCSVREKATDKVFSELGRIKKKKKDTTKIAVIGCVAKESGKEIYRRAPYVDYVYGPQAWHLLLHNLAKDFRDIDVDTHGVDKFDELPMATDTAAAAFVSIQEGCNHFCTYCIVPFTRGREVSRPFDKVMDEVRHLVKLGAIEINFLGQNVNNYQDDNGKNLADLVRETAKLDNVQRIRFTTSYPTCLTDELIDLYRTEPKLIPFIYLPIQAGGDKTLKRMNRRYTRDQYFAIIDKLKAANPNIQVSSDFIVGFPGESDADFEDTLDAVRRVRPIQSFSFKYSKRPHTGAALLPDQIDPDVAQDRLEKLQTLLKDIQREFNESCVGQKIKVLVEHVGRDNPNIIICRSENMQTVVLPKDESLIGKIIEVEITKANTTTLKGQLC